MTMILRRNLTRDLTPDEVDEMFEELYGRLGAVEDDASDTSDDAEISHFKSVGDQFLVYMYDGRVLGPYDLPVIERPYRGNWAPNTTYFKYDEFNAAGKLYEVLLDHVSASTFDPGANDGLGHDYYIMRLDIFGIPHTVENDAAVIDITRDHVNTFTECTFAGDSDNDGVTVYFAADVVADLPLDSELHIVQAVDGVAVTFTWQADSDGAVTMKYSSSRRLPMTAGEGAVVTFKKIGDTTLRFFGDLAITDGSDASV